MARATKKDVATGSSATSWPPDPGVCGAQESTHQPLRVLRGWGPSGETRQKQRSRASHGETEDRGEMHVAQWHFCRAEWMCLEVEEE